MTDLIHAHDVLVHLIVLHHLLYFYRTDLPKEYNNLRTPLHISIFYPTFFGTVFGGSIRVVGSHSPGGNTVT